MNSTPTQTQSREGWTKVIREMAPRAETQTGNTILSLAGRLIHQTVSYVRFGDKAPRPKAKMPLPARPTSKAKTQVLRFICDKQYTEGWSKVNANPGTQARRRCRTAGDGNFRTVRTGTTKEFSGFMMRLQLRSCRTADGLRLSSVGSLRKHPVLSCSHLSMALL